MMIAQERMKSWLVSSVDRRTFLKVSGTVASAAMASQVFTVSNLSAAQAASTLTQTGEFNPDPLETAEDIIYSVCQMCHSRCGIRAKVKEGILVKLDGNPYHPNNRDVDENNNPDQDWPTRRPPDQAFTELGRHVPERPGRSTDSLRSLPDPTSASSEWDARNSGQWETISWEQAFSEIATRIRAADPRSRVRWIDPSHPGTRKKEATLLGVCSRAAASKRR